MILKIWAGFVLMAGAGLIPVGAQEKEKPNVSFGKTQDLEIELVTVPDSVGSGGKPAPTGADAKASQEGRWLRIDVPFATEKKITPEVNLNSSWRVMRWWRVRRKPRTRKGLWC